MKKSKSVGTHDGSFHADEVTACALLLLFKRVDPDKVLRSRDSQTLAECEYVCDVGGIYDPEKKLFDHHQADYRGSYSSAGMVLEYLYRQGDLTQKEYEFFNQSLVQGVDAHDNGKALYAPGYATFSQVIANFAPISYDATPEEFRAAFDLALQFAFGHVERLWQRYLYSRRCKDMVAERMKEYRDCLIFDKAIPWQENFFELGGEQHPARFVIMPSGVHWKLRGIPPDLARKMEVRMPLPSSWAGLSNHELQQASGIAGAIFCHKGRFISVWKTKEDALQALGLVLGGAS